MEKEYKFKTLAEFKKEFSNEYIFLKKNNLLQRLCLDMNWKFFNRQPSKYWSKEKCIAEAKKYSSRSEWIKNSPKSYDRAAKRGLINICTSHMSDLLIIKNNWTIKENVINESKKYSSRSKWKKASISSFLAAKRYGWFNECTKHMK